MVLYRSRRAFIATLVAAATGAGGWWFWRNQFGDQTPEVRLNPWTELVVSTLRQRLDYLELEEEGVVHFARDLRKRRLHTLLRRLKAGDAETAEWLVQQFLMSSDFFWNGADESRPVGYMGYYDPYERPCANPFARPV